MYRELWQAVSQYARTLEAQIENAVEMSLAPAPSISPENEQGTRIFEKIRATMGHSSLREYSLEVLLTEDCYALLKKSRESAADTSVIGDFGAIQGVPVKVHAHMPGVHYWVYVGGPK